MKACHSSINCSIMSLLSQSEGRSINGYWFWKNVSTNLDIAWVIGWLVCSRVLAGVRVALTWAWPASRLARVSLTRAWPLVRLALVRFDLSRAWSPTLIKFATPKFVWFLAMTQIAKMSITCQGTFTAWEHLFSWNKNKNYFNIPDMNSFLYLKLMLSQYRGRQIHQ